MLEENERAKKLEDERYEQSLKERALRVSNCGPRSQQKQLQDHFLIASLKNNCFFLVRPL